MGSRKRKVEFYDEEDLRRLLGEDDLTFTLQTEP